MQWNFVPINFTQGLSQKTDDKQITNQWLKLENVVMEKSGKFQKRRGFAKGSNLGGTALVESPSKTVLSAPFAGDSNVRVDKIIDLGIRTETAPGTYANTNLGTVSMNQGGAVGVLYGIRFGTDYVTLRWRKFNTDFTVSTDTEIGTMGFTSIRSTTWVGVSDTTTSRGCCAVAAAYRNAPNLADVIVYVDGVEYLVQSNIDAARLCAVGYGNYVYLSYLDTTALVTRVKRFNLTSLTVDASYNIAVVSQAAAMNISADGTILYVGASNQIYRFDAALTPLSNGGTGPVGSYVTQVCRSGIAVFYDANHSYIQTSLGRVPVYSTRPAFTFPVVIGGVEYIAFTALWPGVQSYPIASGLMYVKADAAELASSGINIETQAFYSQAAFAIGLSQSYGTYQAVPTSVSLKLVKWTTGTDASAINVFGDPIYQTSTLFTLLGQFSGSRRSAPYGLPYAPTITAAAQTANNNSYVTGKYIFTAVIKEILPSGRVAYSAPAIPFEFTLGTANRTINVTIACPKVESNRAANMTISLYVILPGTNHYQTVVEGYMYSELVVLESSSPIIAPALYTSGGILEDIPPPLCRGTMAVAKNRIWVMSAELPEVRFSDELYPGEAPQFIEAFALQLIPNGGNGQTVREIDGKIVVFQKYCVSATFGDGPDFTGNNPYPALQVIARDIGAINGNSVVTTNEGIFFLSSKGLWIIDRSLTVQFIGSAVEDDTPNIIAAAKLTDTEQIWFFTSTKAIIYDAYHKLWTTAPLGISGITDAKVIDGTLHVLAGGYDYTLSGTSDDTGNITVKLTSGWMSLAGLQGFERFRRISFLASQVASNTMTVTLRYDFSATDFETFNCSSAALITTGDTVQWQIRPRRQKCESLQLEISYTGATGGVSFSSFAIEVGTLGLSNRLKTTNRVKGN